MSEGESVREREDEGVREGRKEDEKTNSTDR